MSFDRDDKIDEVEMAIIKAIKDLGGYVGEHADELIARLTEVVVDDPRSDWQDDEDDDAEDEG